MQAVFGDSVLSFLVPLCLTLLFPFVKLSSPPIPQDSGISQQYDLVASHREYARRLDWCKFNGGVFYYDKDTGGAIRAAFYNAHTNNPEVYDRLAYHMWSRPAWPGFMPYLADKYGWKMEPRWLIVNKHGEVTYTSTEVPSDEEILRRLDDAGIQQISQIYKDFIKKHPSGRDDALLLLLHHQFEVARVKLRTHLVDNGWNRVQTDRHVSPELQRVLTSAEDYGVWGDFAETLKLVIETEAWTAFGASGYKILDSVAQIMIYR